MDSKKGLPSRTASALSAKELFQWRKADNSSLPQRGGVKEYEPDGTWIQGKFLEAFYEDHLNVLKEPRVEKSGNIVKGTWNSEMKLVNIEKTGKFWMKMGFADNYQNWLHPEEALFLMEVNCLDVVHNGLALSLQEAYGLMLQSSCDISEEEYQVYAHLRRLGFIVVRHAGKLDLTPYEKKIGIYQHSKQKKKKQSKKHESSPKAVPSTDSQTNSPNDIVADQDNLSKEVCTEDSDVQMIDEQRQVASHDDRCDCGKGTEENSLVCAESKNCLSSDKGSETTGIKDKCENIEGSLSAQNNNKIKRKVKHTMEENAVSCLVTTEPSKKKLKIDESSIVPSEQNQVQDPWSDAVHLSLRPTQDRNSSLTSWDFKDFYFPDIGGGTDTVSLPIPPADCLPPNVGLNEDYDDICMFDVEEYRLQQRSSSAQNDEDFSHLRKLEFSYAEWYKDNFRPIKAKNWKEWKIGLNHQDKSFMINSPVAQLWQGETTPLVQPKDSESTASLLDKLAVIQPYKGPVVCKPSHESVKISFDVYLPNTTYKKSSPGPPDFRVCLSRQDQPPELFDVLTPTAHLGDDVPLHWAIVRCGEISFFVFPELNLPVHPSSLG